MRCAPSGGRDQPAGGDRVTLFSKDQEIVDLATDLVGGKAERAAPGTTPPALAPDRAGPVLDSESAPVEVVPWAAERCVPRWHGERGARAVSRWRDTAREAAKQARRARIPEVREPAKADDVAGMIRAAACAVLLTAGAEVRLADVPVPPFGMVVVVAGPEGGLTDVESGRFAAAGAVAARLGPSVLRSSTAGAVAAAVLLSRSTRW